MTDLLDEMRADIAVFVAMLAAVMAWPWALLCDLLEV